MKNKCFYVYQKNSKRQLICCTFPYLNYFVNFASIFLLQVRRWETYDVWDKMIVRRLMVVCVLAIDHNHSLPNATQDVNYGMLINLTPLKIRAQFHRAAKQENLLSTGKFCLVRPRLATHFSGFFTFVMLSSWKSFKCCAWKWNKLFQQWTKDFVLIILTFL